MEVRTFKGWSCGVSLALLGVCGCSSTDSPAAGSAGAASAAGGSLSTAGTVAGAAGVPGGVVTSGGATAAGGNAPGAAAGSTPSGTSGTSSAGGSGPAGGASTGGSATGGTGAGGSAAGGSGSVPSGDPVPSPGCSAAPTTTSCNTQGSPCTLDVSGTERKYWVQLPDNYDAKHPYPVVFEYHPLGGNGWQGLTMYQIRPKFPNAIYVSPDGLTSGQYQGFSNTNGEDEAMTRAIMTELEGKYCVDKARYFSTGFSFGGSMSYTAACNMSDVFRAIGAMSGAPISGATCTTKKPARPVAVWATHGDMDQALPITMAEPIIASFVTNNGCSMDTKAVEPSPCVEYQGCMTGAPVTWCVRKGDDHSIPSFAAAAIAKFFQQF